jgi:hypothetical protein
MMAKLINKYTKYIGFDEGWTAGVVNFTVFRNVVFFASKNKTACSIHALHIIKMNIIVSL